MTQVITRYFESAVQAGAAKHELVYRRRLPAGIVQIFDRADGLADTLSDAQVEAATIRAYEKKLANGGAVMLVKAGFKPLNVARMTREVMAEMDAVNMGGITEEVYIKDPPGEFASVLKSHPLFLSRTRSKDPTAHYMADFPIPLISRREPTNASIFSDPHGHMANFPIPLVSDRKPFTGSIFSDPHGHMANFPIPLLSSRKPYTKSIIAPHAHMANFPIKLISRRKPFTRSIFKRHARMAGWPIPHLIHQKMNQANALMPGGPRMANFPIPLISKRQPFTKSIFGRHARMASFPIPLLSGRKPYTGSIVGKHARMADKFLPLVVREPSGKLRVGEKTYSLSKKLGLPTIISR